jgi:hypothetical protein
MALNSNKEQMKTECGRLDIYNVDGGGSPPLFFNYH